MSRIGLVLSGGGAKGAYQVGVLKALAELGVKVSCVSGTSIGAINGAIVASSPSMEQAYRQLHQLWLELAQQCPIQLDKTKITTWLAWQSLSGLSFSHPAGRVLRTAKPLVDQLMPSFDDGVCQEAPLNSLFDKYLDVNCLKQGLPLYVGLFEKETSALSSIGAVISAELGLSNTKASTIVKVQDHRTNQYQDLIKASAALPVIFQAQSINGKEYIDGGVGDWQGNTGNTPAKPLVEIERCEYVIVSHLEQGSPWLAQSRNTTSRVIEIRPQYSLQGVLDFSSQNIMTLMDQGYQDTMQSLMPYVEAVNRDQTMNINRSARNESCKRLENDGFQIR